MGGRWKNKVACLDERHVLFFHAFYPVVAITRASFNREHRQLLHRRLGRIVNHASQRGARAATRPARAAFRTKHGTHATPTRRHARSWLRFG